MVVHDCSWLSIVVRGCSWLSIVVHVCPWLSIVVPVSVCGCEVNAGLRVCLWVMLEA